VSFKLTVDEGKFLTKLARRAIVTFLTTMESIDIPLNTSKKLTDKFGVFVTLNKITRGKAELRGCIGFPFPTFSLVRATIDAATSAATSDPRFSRVTLQELKDIVVEISVLTPPVLIEVADVRNYVHEVKIGRDGLIVERGWSRGLLLPQVPVEWNWDVAEFLANCCMKAGLPPDAWLVNGTKIYKFSCVIARESSPEGPVEVIDMRKREHYG
jgi:uncharacterized protein (TIGR00296 family)